MPKNALSNYVNRSCWFVCFLCWCELVP